MRLPLELDTLSISNCVVVESVPKGLVAFLTHIRTIHIYDCPSLRLVQGESLPTSLCDLSVESCKRWEFPIPMERMCHYTSLEQIHLSNIGKNLVSFPLGIFPNLRDLELLVCEDLKNVYIPEGIISSINLMALTALEIEGCRKLEKIGKETGIGEAKALPAPNLRQLAILPCENVKPLILEVEVLLSKLKILRIDNWNKMSSMWIPTHRHSMRSLLRPSCLQGLLVGDYSGECFPDEASTLGPLPTCLKVLVIQNSPKLRELALGSLTSLERLHIYDCPELRYLALQGLTSLQQLIINRCPQLQCLPAEGLRPSLGRLDVWQCPLLEERCQPEIGHNWSKINHIPCVEINLRFISGP